MNRRDHKPAWLKLLIAVFLVAQFSVQAHATEHDGIGEASCISCTAGGALSHGAAGPTFLPIEVQVPGVVIHAAGPVVSTAPTGAANLARAPPSIL